jgi:polysaccharide export outer membrane protein
VKLTKVFLAGFMMLPVAGWAQEPAVNFPRPGLAAGDQIAVHMYDFPDLGSGVHVHVATDGTVHLPYAGTIQAAGMSPDEFQSAITQALRDRGIVKDPNVTVEIETAVNMTVDVIGQVQAPKAIPLYAPEPISYILSQVGGFNGLAAHHLTIIHPRDELPTSLDYEPDAPSAATLHTMVQPGDIVHVSSRGVYFIAGEVKQLTLLEALAQCGGITNIAARSKMRILRTIDGKREEIMVDQVKLYKGEVADPIIHPNDIIYIPTSYLRQQTNNLFSTALSGLYAASQLKSIAQ